MAYTKQTFTEGQTLTADNMNHIEQGIKDLDDGKQEKLVSGTNLKTINGQSLLGSGDITVEGGSGGEGTSYDLKASDYGVVVGTVDMDAMNALLVVAKEANKTIRFDDGEYLFPNTIVVPSNVWLKGGANTVLRLTSDSTDTKLISITNVGNVRLDSLKFKGYNTALRPTTKGSNVGVHVERATGVLITNCLVTGFDLYGIYSTLLAVDIEEPEKWHDCMQITNCIIELCYHGLHLGFRSEYSTITNVKCGYNNIGCYNGGGNNSYCNCMFNSNVTGFYLESENMQNPAHGGCTGCSFNHNTQYSLCVNKMLIGWSFCSCQFFYGDMQIVDSKGAVFTGCILGGSGTIYCTHSKGLENANLLTASYFHTDSTKMLSGSDNSLFVYNCLPDRLPSNSTGDTSTTTEELVSYSLDATKPLSDNAFVANMEWVIEANQQIDYIELPTQEASVGASIKGIDVYAVNAETRSVIEHIVVDKTSIVTISKNLNKPVIRLTIGKAYEVPICLAFQCDRTGTNVGASIGYGKSSTTNGNYVVNIKTNEPPQVGTVLPENNSAVAVSCAVYMVVTSEE